MYTNHSGGAQGADTEWKSVGELKKVAETTIWRPHHIKKMHFEDKMEMQKDLQLAAKALGRPDPTTPWMEIILRNWFPAHYAQAIFAVAPIVQPWEKDFRGFKNDTHKPIVAGGTGWAVQLGIQKEKPVFVFDLINNSWYRWSYLTNDFVMSPTPKLTPVFAGIGSRKMTVEGVKAINEVYDYTLKHLK